MVTSKKSKKKPICMCVDRILTGSLKVRSAAVAINENPENGSMQTKFKNRPFGSSSNPLSMALLAGKKWLPGRTLNIFFVDGSKLQKDKVKLFASKWLDFANIKFDFGSTRPNSDVRISFVSDPGSWSYVGTDNLSIPKNEVTMNFGWLRAETADDEWERVVVHEFGHALGAIHEHQNPQGGIQWNTKAVYDYFSGPPNNWTKDEIELNVLMKYSNNQLNASKFDKASVMLYSFDGAFIKGGVGTANNMRLSARDKQFIAKQYPK
jgi:Astacin (Peptidase family M12A)